MGVCDAGMPCRWRRTDQPSMSGIITPGVMAAFIQSAIQSLRGNRTGVLPEQAVAVFRTKNFDRYQQQLGSTRVIYNGLRRTAVVKQ